MEELQEAIMKVPELIEKWQEIEFDGPLTVRNIQLAKKFAEDNKDKLFAKLVQEIKEDE